MGSFGGDRGRALLLNGHVDVVPPGPLELWTTPPFDPQLEGDRLRGRGTLDMKGGLACALAAASALKRSGARLRGRLSIASVIGEEDGGVGTLAMIERGHSADGAVVMEPTASTVAHAQAGCENFRVRIHGRAAHGALRTEGVSAIEKVAPVLEALRGLEAERNRDPEPGFEEYTIPYAIAVGRVRGGVWASSVPELVVLEGRFGIRTDEEPREARAQLERAVDEGTARDPWLRDHAPVVEWWGGRFAAARTDIDDPLVNALIGAHEAHTGAVPRVGAVPYGADMGLLVRYGGMPTVLYGPGDVRNAHQPDESISVRELEAVTRSLVLLALRYCGADS